MKGRFCSPVNYVFENLVDLIVLDGDKKNSLPSTIVKIDDEITVIREGALKIKL